MRFDGKTAVVTGGSRGIGKAISLRLGSEGALVAVHYGSNEDAAAETVAAIVAAGGTAFAVPARLGRPGDVEGLFSVLDEELRSRTGTTHLDIVVNNAGIGGTGGHLADATSEDFDEMVAVNVRAPLFINQAAVERMSAGGRLIAVSSAVTHKAWPQVLVYSMTKAALNTMTRTAAKELGEKGITINAVGPGLIDTDLNSDWVHSSPEAEAAAGAHAALGRIGEPQDVADAVAFLASDESRWITGQYIDVSGGTNL
ncbi:MAG: short-chain dehydrogenase [Conexibacter sp.]|nr:short-chain dehydrogenase [Conexibacter sp.]